MTFGNNVHKIPFMSRGPCMAPVGHLSKPSITGLVNWLFKGFLHQRGFLTRSEGGNKMCMYRYKHLFERMDRTFTGILSRTIVYHHTSFDVTNIRMWWLMAWEYGDVVTGRYPVGEYWFKAAITMDPMKGSHISDSSNAQRFPTQTCHVSLCWHPHMQSHSSVLKIESEDNFVNTLQSYKHNV